MAELTDLQKTEIVSMLARFHRPAEIIAYFGEEHGLELVHRQITAYDPTKAHYDAGDKWRDLFDAVRKAHLEDLSSHPVASQGYRLGMLQKGIAAAEKAKNWPLVAQLLEQAAKETGGLLTNMRDVRIDDRRPRASELTPEDRKLAIAEIIRQAMEAREAGQLPAPAPQP